MYLEDAVADLREFALTQIELVAEGAHDLFQGVLAEGEPDHGAVLVHHGGAVRLLRLELAQEVGDGHRVRHEDGFPGEGSKVGLGSARTRSRTSFACTKPTIESRPTSQSGSRLCPLARMRVRFSSIGRSRERKCDVDTRHHDVPHLEVHQPEDVLGDLVLPFGDLAGARREGEDAADLLGGVRLLVTRIDG